MPRILTSEQVESFYTDGYLIVKNVYDVTELNRIRQIFTGAFVSDLWRNSPFDSQGIINDIYYQFPGLTSILFNEKSIRALKDILGEDLSCIPECAVHNRYFDWHRDTNRMEQAGYTLHKEQDKFILQTAIYFQDNDVKGGSMTVIPGSQNKADRLFKMHTGNIFLAAWYKLAKLMKKSVFNELETRQQPLDLPSALGDFVIFNAQIDHRSTFLRDTRGKPLPSFKEKFAIFNAFTNDPNLAQSYFDSLKNSNESYSRFLKKAVLHPDLIRISQELRFNLCYS